MKAIAFRAVGTRWGFVIVINQGRLLHLLGQFKVNHWNGIDNVEFMISDASVA